MISFFRCHFIRHQRMCECPQPKHDEVSKTPDHLKLKREAMLPTQEKLPKVGVPPCSLNPIPSVRKDQVLLPENSLKNIDRTTTLSPYEWLVCGCCEHISTRRRLYGIMLLSDTASGRVKEIVAAVLLRGSARYTSPPKPDTT